MSDIKTTETCAGACDLLVHERNRYFTGKHLTARDFQIEQDYFVSQNRLHNRVLHGWGVVCGLDVAKHPNRDCRDHWLKINPGIALDCCGHELILQDAVYFDHIAGRPWLRDGKEDSVPFVVCITYREEAIESVPVLYTRDKCDAAHTEPNRVRETVCVVARRLDELDGCWKDADGSSAQPCRDDCGEATPGPGGSCLTPECPCGGVVPLALVRPMRQQWASEQPEADKQYVYSYEPDHTGRRALPTPPHYLTHIASINWPHGGVLQLKDFEEVLDRTLRVRFDRRLKPTPHAQPGYWGQFGTGINPMTFSVQASVSLGELRQMIGVSTIDNPPELHDDGCEAYFRIRRENIHGFERFIGHVIYITLRCDFVLDCRGNPVDGNFTGVLPSGNGTPGSTFESWFLLVDEYDPRWMSKDTIQDSKDLIARLRREASAGATAGTGTGTGTSASGAPGGPIQSGLAVRP